jgi:hypothetical protein
MVFEFRLKGSFALCGLALCVATGCVLLARQVLFNFIVFSLSDSRSPVSTGALETATGYFPTSARLNARLAEAAISDPARDLALASRGIDRATRLSPNDYRLLVVLASVKESQQDLTGAEKALRDAADLAPSNIDVRWRLANLLLRAGRVSDSLVEFRTAVSGDGSLMPITLDLLWRVTGGDIPCLKAVTPANAPSNMALANFLVKQDRAKEAARIFEGIERGGRLASVSSSEFVSRLISIGELVEARRLWVDTVSSGSEPAEQGRTASLVWNGGFESNPIPGLAQFDWHLSDSNFVAIGFDNGAAHQGTRSLRVEFKGKDTTRLDGEIEQRLVLQSGRHYMMEYYVRTRNLVTTEGPRVALVWEGDPAWSPAGTPISGGTEDWRKMEFEFVAPTRGAAPAASAKLPDSRDKNGTSRAPRILAEGAEAGGQGSEEAIAVTVKVIRTPKYSYDEPMRGTIWFDDFRISQIGRE